MNPNDPQFKYANAKDAQDAYYAEKVTMEEAAEAQGFPALGVKDKLLGSHTKKNVQRIHKNAGLTSKNGEW